MDILSTTEVMPKIVLGIPTFKRPAQLSALLESLLPELMEQTALVIVADNECGKDALAVVNAFSKKWEKITYIPVPERGVSAVRNALLAHASVARPDWDWLVMVDDDGLVTSGWLKAMIETGERLNTHLVGGPVVGPMPTWANCFARNSIYAARRRWPTGLVPTLNQTQNLAISKRTLELLKPPFFRAHYGASGGEDYDFFRQVTQAGGTIGWCDEALVIEPPPDAALRTQAVLMRYFTTGAYMAVVDASYDTKFKTLLSALKGLLAAGLKAVLAMLLFNKNKLAKEILFFSHYLGRVFGLLGLRTSRYIASNKQGGAHDE
jgi:glycosyltransferase involved in cell wall biosynthesis